MIPRTLKVKFYTWLARRAKRVLRWCWNKHPPLRPAYIRGPFAQDVRELPGGTIIDYARRLGPFEGWGPEGVDPLANTPGCESHGVENCRTCGFDDVNMCR